MKKGKHYCGLFFRLLLNNIIGMWTSDLVHRDESKERGGLATDFFFQRHWMLFSLEKKEGTSRKWDKDDQNCSMDENTFFLWRKTVFSIYPCIYSLTVCPHIVLFSSSVRFSFLSVKNEPADLKSSTDMTTGLKIIV